MQSEKRLTLKDYFPKHSSFFPLQNYTRRFFLQNYTRRFFRDDAIITRDVFSMQYYTRRFFNAIITRDVFSMQNLHAMFFPKITLAVFLELRFKLRVSLNLVPRVFRKDPGIGWSRASSKIDRPRGCGESIKLLENTCMQKPSPC